jgi:hypothetical protein
MRGIPDNIEPEHILRAIEEADKSGVPVERKSGLYDLVYNEKTYPLIWSVIGGRVFSFFESRLILISG